MKPHDDTNEGTRENVIIVNYLTEDNYGEQGSRVKERVLRECSRIPVDGETPLYTR